MKQTKLLLAGALSCLFISPTWATNGSFNHGVGQKAMGMGGAGIAYPQDSLAAGTNPAGMVMVGSRVDMGLTIFRPRREAEIVDSDISSLNGKFNGNHTELFFMPEFGYNQMVSDDMSFGITVFGNGGMNTDYKKGIPMFNGSEYPAKTGINLMQMFIVPTFSWKASENHSVGIGINLVGQMLNVKGVQAFDNAVFSESPGNVTNNGNDFSYGAGLRLGWIGKMNDWLSLGATYQSRVYMSEFKDYKGLLAESGSFDIPENYGAGIALRVNPKMNVAFDVVRIKYSDVNAMANGGPTTNPNWLPIGSGEGAGFGWDDQTVYKLGMDYQLNEAWVVRAGYNHGSAPMDKQETLMNILAPATVEDHVTLGATWAINKTNELTFHYMHAFENEIKGNDSTPDVNIGPFPVDLGESNIKMSQDAFGVGYSWKL